MPNNGKKFYLQGSDPSKERFSIRRLVNFEWNIIYACNYRCSHCIFEGKWEEYGPRTVYKTPDEWLKVWQRIHRRYDQASILITGGEPFLYPGFAEIVKKISTIHWPINISTNSSTGLEEFTHIADPGKVSVSLSFQPQYDTIEGVIKRQKMLKSRGFSSEFINFCAYPPYLDKLAEYAAQATAAGETLKVIAFYGTFEGREYPAGYGAAEKKLLGLDNASWQKNVFKKGTPCNAGRTSALIYPDGKVARCGQVGERVPVGNIFDEDFALLSEPKPCDVDFCPCIKT